MITLPIIYYKMGIRKLCGKSKASIHTKNHLLYLTIITKELGTMFWLNGR